MMCRYVCVYVYVCMCMCVCVCVCVCLYEYVCVGACRCINNRCIHIRMGVYISVLFSNCLALLSVTHTHTYIHKQQQVTLDPTVPTRFSVQLDNKGIRFTYSAKSRGLRDYVVLSIRYFSSCVQVGKRERHRERKRDVCTWEKMERKVWERCIHLIMESLVLWTYVCVCIGTA